MTQVDFHILNQNGFEAVMLYACRLTEKGWRGDRKIYIHTANREDAEALDKQLWSFRPESFIPHGLQGEVAEDTNVVIGWGDDPGLHHDVLINLDNKNVPEYLGRFQKMMEIVSSDPLHKEAGRDKWRYYQHRGYPLKKYDIDLKKIAS
ncbi:MAG: DNA polymerase III subunit chi [Cellvibrionaceae bacterium]